MKAISLLLLRISLGLLMIIWGLNKLLNVDGSQAVSDAFYLGLLSSASLLPILGGLQVLLGVAIVVGFARIVCYPILLLLTATTMLAVWQSIIDPWGWWFVEGSNVLFYPALITFFAALVLTVFRDEDTLSLGGRG